MFTNFTRVFLPGTCKMRRAVDLILAGGVLAALPTIPAVAQDKPVPGPYVVGRLGVQKDSDLRFKTQDTTARSTFPQNADMKSGPTGEIGAGYDFGGFRLETTIGYESAGVDTNRLKTSTLTASGRTKTLNLGISGYYDVDLGGPLRPYFGGGIGVSQVHARLSRLTTAGVGSTLRGSDWGFRWHADLGVGYSLSDATVIELGARYAKVNGLSFSGKVPGTTGAPVAREYRPTLSSTSLLLGLRQRF